MPGADRPTVRRRCFHGVVIAWSAGAAILLSGCGTADRTPSVQGLPLASGSHVVVRQKVCDKGSDAYCAVEMVVRGASYPNSRSLALAEKLILKQRRWSKVNAPVGLELAADSPGDRLRVTYAGAGAELQAIDLGWIQRSRQISLALSREIFNHRAAMAILLQLGTTH